MIRGYGWGSGPLGSECLFYGFGRCNSRLHWQADSREKRAPSLHISPVAMGKYPKKNMSKGFAPLFGRLFPEASCARRLCRALRKRATCKEYLEHRTCAGQIAESNLCGGAGAREIDVQICAEHKCHNNNLREAPCTASHRAIEKSHSKELPAQRGCAEQRRIAICTQHLAARHCAVHLHSCTCSEPSLQIPQLILWNAHHFFGGACYHRGGRTEGLARHGANMLSGQSNSGRNPPKENEPTRGPPNLLVRPQLPASAKAFSFSDKLRRVLQVASLGARAMSPGSPKQFSSSCSSCNSTNTQKKWTKTGGVCLNCCSL